MLYIFKDYDMFMINLMSVLLMMFFVLDNSQSIADYNKITVVDGDTLRIDDKRIRIWGIDAPELKQTCLRSDRIWFCGKEARSFLVKKIDENVVQCDTLYKDRYMRTVARCKLLSKKISNNADEVKDLGSEMVRNGWAFDYDHYSHGAYSLEQQDARENRRGVWSSEFEFPWEWRRRK